MYNYLVTGYLESGAISIPSIGIIGTYNPYKRNITAFTKAGTCFELSPFLAHEKGDFWFWVVNLWPSRAELQGTEYQISCDIPLLDG